MAAAAARPLVTVQALERDISADASTTLPIPDVMRALIRLEIVNFVQSNISNNNRQPYVVSRRAGRAISRIPRVAGGGTHRVGHAKFGNMFRGGRMFASTRIWRRWHRKINVNKKCYAVVSAIVASVVPSLVLTVLLFLEAAIENEG